MRIALIDSHQIFTEALRMNLINSLPAIESIDHYSSIQAFTTEARAIAPTLIITELCFNGKYDKGVDVIFRMTDKNTKIIVLTSLNDDWLIRSYMRLGAKAFLTKTCLSQELFAAIAQVQKGNLFLSEDVQNILSAGITAGAPSVDYLSSIERSILEALSREEPLKAIANHLNISMIELKYHRRMLMERFNTKHFADLLDLAQKPGFLKSGTNESKPDAGSRGGKPVVRFPHKDVAVRV